jgi:glutathione S-transferase
VPALELDDGSLLTENNVIQQYLSDSCNKGAELLPKSGIERYRVLEWMNYVSTEMHKGCSPLFNPNIPEQLKQQVFKPMLVNKLAFLDKVLANHAYLSGERFCLADAYLFVVLRWLPALNINRSEFSHVEAYYQSAAKRPAVAKSLEQETLSA